MMVAGRPRLALATLALGAFTVGTSELVVVGILDPIAHAADVSISTAGTLVSAYALGIAVGGPALTVATGRLDRRLMLLAALAAYVAANVLVAATASFGVLMAARFAAGSVHGAFIGVASVTAAALAGEGREGRAISMVFGGVALATVIGVPLGTLAGQTLGWRATFVSVAVLGAAALALSVAFVPRVRRRGADTVGAAARAAFALPVLATLGVGLLIIGGQFTVLTYLEPFLRRVTDVSGGAVSGFLLAFGCATAAGTFASGRAADRSAGGALIVANAGLATAVGALYVAGPAPVATALVLVVFGVVGFGLVSTALQLRVIGLAGPGGDLAASLGASAANAGIAIGALVGGQVVAHLGVRDVTLAAAAILLAALPATVAARSLRPATTAGAPAAGQDGRGPSDARLGSTPLRQPSEAVSRERATTVGTSSGNRVPKSSRSAT